MAQPISADAADDWVFCENATSAVNGVLAGLALEPGDEIVTTSHAYGAVLKAMRAWAGRRGAAVVVADLPVFLQNDDQVVDAVSAALNGTANAASPASSITSHRQRPWFCRSRP